MDPKINGTFCFSVDHSLQKMKSVSYFLKLRGCHCLSPLNSTTHIRPLEIPVNLEAQNLNQKQTCDKTFSLILFLKNWFLKKEKGREEHQFVVFFLHSLADF